MDTFQYNANVLGLNEFRESFGSAKKFKKQGYPPAPNKISHKDQINKKITEIQKNYMSSTRNQKKNVTRPQTAGMRPSTA